MGKLIDVIRSWFCEHEWECLVDGVAVYSEFSAVGPYSMPAYYEWLYVCKKCGKIKRIKS